MAMHAAAAARRQMCYVLSCRCRRRRRRRRMEGRAKL